MASSTQRRSFLDLPAEIRNRVYSFALVDDDADVFVCHSQPNGRGSISGIYHGKLSVALLQTCRVIRQEAAPAFDGHNEFYFVNAVSWKW